MCAGGALGPRPGAGGGPRGREVPGWLASAPFSSPPPLLRPLQGTGPRGAPRGKREGCWRQARPGHALDRGPSSPGPWRLPGEAAGVGGAAGWSARTPPLGGVLEAPRPRSLARSLGGGSVPAFHGPSLPPPPSGFRGLRTEGRESGTRAPQSPAAAAPGLTPPRACHWQGKLSQTGAGARAPSSATPSSNPTPTPPPPTPSPPTDPNLAVPDGRGSQPIGGGS